MRRDRPGRWITRRARPSSRGRPTIASCAGGDRRAGWCRTTSRPIRDTCAAGRTGWRRAGRGPERPAVCSSASHRASTTLIDQVSSVSRRANWTRRSSRRAWTSKSLSHAPSWRMAWRIDQAAKGSESSRALYKAATAAGPGSRSRPRAIAASRRTAASRSWSSCVRGAAAWGSRRIPADRAAWRRTRAEGSLSVAAIAFLASPPPIASSAQRGMKPAGFRFGCD